MNPLDIINNRNALILLVTPAELKTLCGIAANVQSSNLIPSINLTQDMRIKEILGETLYDNLMIEWSLALQNAANLPIAPINYLALYNKVKPVLIWFSYCYFIPTNGFKVEEKGVMLNDSDFSSNAGVEGIRMMESRARKVGEFYAEELQKYLKENFQDNIDYNEEGKKNDSKFFSGIFFSRTNNC